MNTTTRAQRDRQTHRVHAALLDTLRPHTKRVAAYMRVSVRTVQAWIEGYRRLDVRDVPTICAITESTVIVEELCGAVNGSFVAHPEPDPHAAKTADAARLLRECSEAVVTVECALSDGHVSDDELESCDVECNDIVQATLDLREHIRGLHAQRRGQMALTLAEADAL